MPIDQKNLELKEKFFALRTYLAGLNQIDIALAKAKDKQRFLELVKKKYDLISRTLSKFTDANLVHRLTTLSNDNERLSKLGLTKRDADQMLGFFAKIMPLLEDWQEEYHALYSAIMNSDVETAFSIAESQQKLQKSIPPAPKLSVAAKLRVFSTVAGSILVVFNMGCSVMKVKAPADPVPVKSESAITLEGCYSFPDLRVVKKGNFYYMIGRAKGNQRTFAQVDAKKNLLQHLRLRSANLRGAIPVKYASADGYTYVLMKCPVTGISQ